MKLIQKHLQELAKFPEEALQEALGKNKNGGTSHGGQKVASAAHIGSQLQGKLVGLDAAYQMPLFCCNGHGKGGRRRE